jgi:hypothetical protein
MEEREVEITNLIPVKPFETYTLRIQWKGDKTGKNRLYLIATIGDLVELGKIKEVKK